MSVRAVYDELAPRYHLIHADWEASIGRQGAALAALIGERWPGARMPALDARLRDSAAGWYGRSASV